MPVYFKFLVLFVKKKKNHSPLLFKLFRLVRRDGVVEAATGGGSHKPVAEMELQLHPSVYYALKFKMDTARQRFSLALIDPGRDHGDPKLIANDVPFISNSSAPLTHIGLMEMDSNDGAVVCVYEPQVYVDNSTPKPVKSAPALWFGVARGPVNHTGATPAARPRTKCCGSECSCCVLNHIKWDVLAYFEERYGLDVSKCDHHNDVRHTFCRSSM